MADSTWEARIRDESRIETENPKPLALPHRYLLWKAHRTYLYALETTPEENDDQTETILSLDILPDESIMACQSGHQWSHDVSQRWGLSTKQLIGSAQLEKGQDIEGTYAVQVYEEFIVVEYYSVFRVFSLHGKLLHHVDTGGEYVIKALKLGQNGVFFISSQEDETFDEISCLEMATGTLQHHLVKYQGHMMNYSLIVSGNTLLVRCEEDSHDSRTNGILVYGIHEKCRCSQEQFFRGDYGSLAQASDDPSTIIAAGNIHIDVFKLENGTLSRATTLAIPHNLMSFPILHVTKSLVVLGMGYGNDSTEIDTLEYSLLNGELLRSFGRRECRVGRVATSNGNHLFVGYDSRDTFRDEDTSVKAYCLDGY